MTGNMTGATGTVELNAAVLAEHSTYAWNRSGTRIRCNAAGCGTIMEAANEDDAVMVFARHQAEQLPLTDAPASVALAVSAPEPETAPAYPDERETPPAAESLPATPDTDTDTDPEEPPMATATAVRRNVKELTAIIAEVKKGARVRAVFLSPRYGHFEVTGTVIKGGAGQEREQLIVAGWLINAKDRPGKHLQELEILAASGDHDYPIEPSAAPEHVGIG